MHKDSTQGDMLPATLVTNHSTNFFQGRILLTPVEAGAACGWAKQTVYNKLGQDDFPIPLVIFNGRKMVRVTDLVRYVGSLEPDAHTPQTRSRRPGRPTKSESIRHATEKKARAI